MATSAANTAAITTEQTARTDAVGALATRVDTVAATSAANAAAITTEQTARTNADGALSTRVDTVAAASAANTGAITTEQTARANADGALSTRIDTAQASANGASAAVQVTSSALAGTDGKLAALHTIKTQVTAGGRTYLAGIGIGVEVNGAAVESQILLSAQRVAVLNEDSGGLTTPFVIQNGQVFINQAFIADASITNAKIGNAEVTTLKIGANSVTVPASISGSGGAGPFNAGSMQAVSGGSVSIYLADTAKVSMLVTWQAVTPGSNGGNTRVELRMDGSGGAIFAAEDSTVPGISTSHVASSVATLSAGSHTFQLWFGNDYSSGTWNLGAWSATIIGVMR